MKKKETSDMLGGYCAHQNNPSTTCCNAAFFFCRAQRHNFTMRSLHGFVSLARLHTTTCPWGHEQASLFLAGEIGHMWEMCGWRETSQNKGNQKSTKVHPGKKDMMSSLPKGRTHLWIMELYFFLSKTQWLLTISALQFGWWCHHLVELWPTKPRAICNRTVGGKCSRQQYCSKNVFIWCRKSRDFSFYRTK